MMLILNLLASAAIAAIGLFCVINKMSRYTCHAFRLGWVLLTTGACAALLAPAFGEFHPTLADMLVKVGLLIFLVVERRKRLTAI